MFRTALPGVAQVVAQAHGRCSLGSPPLASRSPGRPRRCGRRPPSRRTAPAPGASALAPFAASAGSSSTSAIPAARSAGWCRSREAPGHAVPVTWWKPMVGADGRRPAGERLSSTTPDEAGTQGHAETSARGSSGGRSLLRVPSTRSGPTHQLLGHAVVLRPRRSVADHLHHEVAPLLLRMRAASSRVPRPVARVEAAHEEDARRPGRAFLVGAHSAGTARCPRRSG